MKNRKALERDRLLVEFGLLIAPLADLCRSDTAPTSNAFRIAVAKVDAGDSKWRESARALTTFAPDVRFNAEFQAIAHVPERLLSQLMPLLADPRLEGDLGRLHEHVRSELQRAQDSLLASVARVPIDWEPELLEANTPYTSYLKVRSALGLVRNRVHYFDRYLKPQFLELFLAELPKTIEIRLVTTPQGVAAVAAQSDLFRKEFGNYSLHQADKKSFHDRNLRVDDRIFSLGPGIDRVGIALTNFGPADSSDAAHKSFDELLASSETVQESP